MRMHCLHEVEASACVMILSPQLGMQRYNLFRTDPIPKILRIGRYRSNPIQAQFYFLNQCTISLFLCVDLIITLLCVKHILLQCFSTGESKVLVCSPKNAVPIIHITALRVLAGKDLHEGMILILFRSSFTFH